MRLLLFIAHCPGAHSPLARLYCIACRCPLHHLPSQDHLDRPYKVLRHKVGSSSASTEDPVVYEEKDEVGRERL
jgi:hypothetical protein